MKPAVRPSGVGPGKLAAHGSLLLTYQKCRQLKTDSDVTFHPQKHSKYTEKPAESWEGEHERLQSRSAGKVEVEDELVPSGMAGTCRGASGLCIRRVGQPLRTRLSQLSKRIGPNACLVDRDGPVPRRSSLVHLPFDVVFSLWDRPRE